MAATNICASKGLSTYRERGMLEQFNCHRSKQSYRPARGVCGTPTPHTAQATTPAAPSSVKARCADKTQVLVFAISSPEILEIRTDGTCSNRGRLSGERTHHWTGVVCQRAEPDGPDFPLSGSSARRRLLDDTTAIVLCQKFGSFVTTSQHKDHAVCGC